jgi:hypothetical protein
MGCKADYSNNTKRSFANDCISFGIRVGDLTMDPMTALALISTGVSVFGDLFGASEQEEALEERKREEEMASDKRQIQADKKMENIIALQKVRAATSGFKYTGSFANLALSSFQDFAEDRQAELLNLHLKENNIDQAESNAIAGGFIKGLTDASQGVFEYYSLNHRKYDTPSEYSPYKYNNPDLFS